VHAVIPAKAGIQGSSHTSQAKDWTPAFAGVTVVCTPVRPEPVEGWNGPWMSGRNAGLLLHLAMRMQGSLRRPQQSGPRSLERKLVSLPPSGST